MNKITGDDIIRSIIEISAVIAIVAINNIFFSIVSKLSRKLKK